MKRRSGLLSAGYQWTVTTVAADIPGTAFILDLDNSKAYNKYKAIELVSMDGGIVGRGMERMLEKPVQGEKPLEGRSI